MQRVEGLNCMLGGFHHLEKVAHVRAVQVGAGCCHTGDRIIDEPNAIARREEQGKYDPGLARLEPIDGMALDGANILLPQGTAKIVAFASVRRQYGDHAIKGNVGIRRR